MEKNPDAYDYSKAQVRLYLPGSPPGARATDSRNGGTAGHSEKGAKGQTERRLHICMHVCMYHRISIISCS